jgi:hypothetical protein
MNIVIERHFLIASFISLLILFPVATVVSTAFSSSEIAGAFYNSIKNNDYTILEPVLSPVMKAAFNEKAFQGLNAKLEGYGALLGYKIVGEGDKDGYHLIYVDLFYEKATITFRLVVNKSSGLLDGIWVQNVRQESSYVLKAFSLPILGGIIGLLAVYIALRRMDWSAIIFGAVLLFITLVIQPPLQQAPFLLSGIRSNEQLLKLGREWLSIAVIWLGFTAGFVQEILKYYASRNKSLVESAYIGAGFGLAEAIILPALALIALKAGLPLTTTSLLYLGLIERILALLFHTSTTLAFSHYYKLGKGRITLLTMIVFHGIIDSLAIYYQLTKSVLSVSASYIIITAIAGVILYKLLPKARKEPLVEQGPIW